MKRVETLIVVAGLGLFAVVVSRIGWTAALTELRRIWIAIPFLIALSVVRLFLQTRSWKIALSAEGLKGSVGELIGIRLASQSMGYLSVLGPAISEPMKIKLLGDDWRSAATATIVDSGVYWFSSVLAGVVGCMAATVTLAHSRYAATVFAITALFAVSAGLLLRKKPLLATLIELLGRRAPGWLKKGAELEQQMRGFRERNSAALHRMVFIGLVCQILLFGEAAVVIFLAKLPVHLLSLIGIEALVRITKMTAGWIPARIGADEGGAVAAFIAFGFAPSAGLMLALARRSRDLLWCVLGLSWLAWKSHQARKNRSFVEAAPYAGHPSHSE
ncbi:MAG TPA: hypothetical protein VHQ95_01320 [Pyrinomonadaceae bacterium]|nr:hypothetical protein [Pyrinomonadaceae bacterium]